MSYSYKAASIEAKYLGPTNSRGSRVAIIVPTSKKTKVIPWDYSLSGVCQNAIKAILPDLENPEFAYPRVSYCETKAGYCITFHGDHDWDIVKAFFGIKD